MPIQAGEPIKNYAQDLSTYCRMNGACLDGEKIQNNRMNVIFYIWALKFFLSFHLSFFMSLLLLHVTNTSYRMVSLLPLPNCLFLHYHNLTLKKTYAAVRVSVCFISICRKCLICCACALYMFHRRRVGNVLSIPLYVLTCKVIDNKATLTLTFDFVCESQITFVNRV